MGEDKVEGTSGQKHGRSSRPWLRRALLAICIVLIAASVSGCRTLNFYAQAIKGQYQLLAAKDPISKLEKDPNLSPELRQRFEVVHDIRDFAQNQLALPVNGHYKHYADVNRPYVLWNIQAAREFSMQPKRWWYPMVGRQQYRGYFNYRSATNYAAALDREGWDVFVGGVQAYSTLGWFKESVLNTFIFDPDPFLAELIFHELSHQEVFARGDTDFNEAFATTVGQEGTRRWLRARRDAAMLADYERDVGRNEQFVGIVMYARRALEAAFGDERTEEDDVRATTKYRDIPEEEMRKRKEAVYEELKRDYQKLKEEWGGDTSYDLFFSRQLNNAKLNSVAAYHDLVPGFTALLEVSHGDLKEFYLAAQRLADMPRKERREWLRVLAISKPLDRSGPQAPVPTQAPVQSQQE